jgi:hypothetical protein
MNNFLRALPDKKNPTSTQIHGNIAVVETLLSKTSLGQTDQGQRSRVTSTAFLFCALTLYLVLCTVARRYR